MPVSEEVGDRRVGLKAGEICRLPKATKGQVLVYGDGGWEVGEAGIAEGDYTSWAHKWTNDFPLGGYSDSRIGFSIDDQNDVLFLTFRSNATPVGEQFAVYDISDYSKLFRSPDGDYTSLFASPYYHFGIDKACVDFGVGGMSKSLQSYLLLRRVDGKTIEVWRKKRTSVLWDHDIQDDDVAGSARLGEISATGKYIVIVSTDKKIILYEGE